MENDIWTLLAAAQAEMPAPRKDKTGQVDSRSYQYASLDACLDSVKPPLNSRGVFLTQYTMNEDGRFYLMTAVRYQGESFVLDSEPYEYDANPQEYGKRETYAKRYGLCKAFALVGDEDTDGDVQGAPQPSQSMKMMLIANAKSLKDGCIKAGDTLEAIDGWYQEAYGGVPMSRLSETQLTEVIASLTARQSTLTMGER